MSTFVDDIRELCRVVVGGVPRRGASSSSALPCSNDPGSRGPESLQPECQAAAVTVSLCAKLFVVCTLAAHELKERRPGAHAVRRACLEAAYRDFRSLRRVIASSQFARGSRKPKESHRWDEELGALVRRAAEEGYESALVESYARASSAKRGSGRVVTTEDPFVVNRVMLYDEIRSTAVASPLIEVVSMSVTNLMEEAKEFWELIESIRVCKDKFRHDQRRRTNTLAYDWMCISFHGSIQSEDERQPCPLAAESFCGGGASVNGWGVSASLLNSLLQSIGVVSSGSSDPLRTPNQQTTVEVRLAEFSMESLAAHCLHCWRSKSTTSNGEVAPRIIVQDDGRQVPRASLTGRGRQAGAVHPFSGHLSHSGFILDEPCGVTGGSDSPNMCVLNHYSPLLHQQTANVLGLPYDFGKDVVPLLRSPLLDKSCPMSAARTGHAGWSVAQRAATFAIAYEAAWFHPDPKDDRMHTNSQGNLMDSVLQSVETIGYFSLDDSRTIRTAAAIDESAAAYVPLADRVVMFIKRINDRENVGGDGMQRTNRICVDDTTAPPPSLSVSQITKFFSVFTCRALVIDGAGASTNVATNSDGNTAEGRIAATVSASNLCFANSRVARLLDDNFVTLLLHHHEISSLVARDPTGKQVAAMIPSLSRSLRVSLEELKTQFVKPGSINPEVEEVPCLRDLRGASLRSASRQGLQVDLATASTLYYAWKLIGAQLLPPERTPSSLAEQQSFSTLCSIVAHLGIPLSLQAYHSSSSAGSVIAQQPLLLPLRDATAAARNGESLLHTLLRYASDHLVAIAGSREEGWRAKMCRALSNVRDVYDRSDGSLVVPFLIDTGVLCIKEDDDERTYDEYAHHGSGAGVCDSRAAPKTFVLSGCVGRAPEIVLPAPSKFPTFEEISDETPPPTMDDDSVPTAVTEPTRGYAATSAKGEHNCFRSEQAAEVADDGTLSITPIVLSSVFRTALGPFDVTDAVVTHLSVPTVSRISSQLATDRAHRFCRKLAAVRSRLHRQDNQSNGTAVDDVVGAAGEEVGSSVHELFQLGVKIRLQAASAVTALHFPSKYAVRHAPPPHMVTVSEKGAPASAAHAAMLPLAGPRLNTLGSSPTPGLAVMSPMQRSSVSRAAISTEEVRTLLDVVVVALEELIAHAERWCATVPSVIGSIRASVEARLSQQYKLEDDAIANARTERKSSLQALHKAQAALRCDGLPPLTDRLVINGQALANSVAAIPIRSSGVASPDGAQQPTDVGEVASLLTTSREQLDMIDAITSDIRAVTTKRMRAAQLKADVLQLRSSLLCQLEEAKAQQRSSLEAFQQECQRRLDVHAADVQCRRQKSEELLRAEISELEVELRASTGDPERVATGLRSQYDHRVASLEEELMSLGQLQLRVTQEQELFAKSLIGRWDSAPHTTVKSPSRAPLQAKRNNAVCFLRPPSSPEGQQHPWDVLSVDRVAQEILDAAHDDHHHARSSTAAAECSHPESVPRLGARSVTLQAPLWCHELAAFSGRMLNYQVSLDPEA